jgi:hypothetical protein
VPAGNADHARSSLSRCCDSTSAHEPTSAGCHAPENTDHSEEEAATAGS